MLYLTLLGAFWLGYYLREVLDSLKRLIRSVEALRSAEEKPPRQPTTFAEPMTKAEVIALMEQERVEAMNER